MSNCEYDDLCNNMLQYAEKTVLSYFTTEEDIDQNHEIIENLRFFNVFNENSQNSRNSLNNHCFHHENDRNTSDEKSLTINTQDNEAFMTFISINDQFEHSLNSHEIFEILTCLKQFEVEELAKNTCEYMNTMNRNEIELNPLTNRRIIHENENITDLQSESVINLHKNDNNDVILSSEAIKSLLDHSLHHLNTDMTQECHNNQYHVENTISHRNPSSNDEESFKSKKLKISGNELHHFYVNHDEKVEETQVNPIFSDSAAKIDENRLKSENFHDFNANSMKSNLHDELKDFSVVNTSVNDIESSNNIIIESFEGFELEMPCSETNFMKSSIKSSSNVVNHDPYRLSSLPLHISRQCTIWNEISPQTVSKRGKLVYWLRDCFRIHDNLSLQAILTLSQELNVPVIVIVSLCL